MATKVTASVDPALCVPPYPLYRVARADDPLKFSRISYPDAAKPDVGNRFDVPDADVLYCATEPIGCYSETIWRLRPTARLRELLANEPGFMVCGVVPAEWRHRRLRLELSLLSPRPFLDVEAAETHEYLTTAMAAELRRLDVDTLDVGLVRGRNRLITRAISSWVHAAVDDSGQPLFSGLRYVSRLGAEECWAVFDRCRITEVNRDPVYQSDQDLNRAAQRMGLVVQ